MSTVQDRSTNQVAGSSTNPHGNDVSQKKKSKKRKRSPSPFDFENEPVPEGDMDAEEFFVDAIMHAVYKPYNPTRRLPGLAWHYTVQWHGYPLTQTSSEEPITHDMFSEGTTFVTEFWQYAKVGFQAARSTTASKVAHPSEPVGKEGDVVFCPRQLLHKWYRSALRSYRRDERANELRLAKRPEDRALKRAKKDLIWWIKRTKIDIVSLAHECGQKGLPLLPEDSESDSSESDQEEKKRKEQEEEEKRKRKKKKKREERERVAALPSVQADSTSKAGGSKGKEGETDRVKKKDKGKGKEKKKEKVQESSGRDSGQRQPSWSPGLFEGGSPGHKQNEKRRQELEKLRKAWEEKRASEGGNGHNGSRPNEPAASSATAGSKKHKKIIVLSDSSDLSSVDEEEIVNSERPVVAITSVRPVPSVPKLKETNLSPVAVPVQTAVPVTEVAPVAAVQQPLFDEPEEPEENIIDSMILDVNMVPEKPASKSFAPIWERNTGNPTGGPTSASPNPVETPLIPVVAPTPQVPRPQSAQAVKPSAPSPANMSAKPAPIQAGNGNAPTASVGASHSENRRPSQAMTSGTSQGNTRPVPPTIQNAFQRRAAVVPARQIPKQQKMLCEVNIRLEGMVQRTVLFEAEIRIQSVHAVVNPQDLFEGHSRLFVISRILDFNVNQDVLASRMVLAHATFSASPSSNVGSTNRRISELLSELGNADMGEGLALVVLKLGIVAVLYSTASPFVDIAKPPASLRETHGLLATFLAFDHQGHHKTSDAAIAAFNVLKNAIPASALHPNIILGSLGFTTDFFRRLEGRKVTVIAQAFRSKVQDGLLRSRALQVTIQEKPDVVIMDENALRELRETRGVRDMAERGTEFWVYGATIPPKENPFWAPTRVFHMEGGTALLPASWLFADSSRALSLAKRIKSTFGWTACITIQTVFLLFQLTRRDSKADLDIKSAASNLLEVLPLVQIRFPLPRSQQRQQRCEGMQAWAKATTSQERLHVAVDYKHIGMEPVSLAIITDVRIHISKQIAELDRAAESDMILRLNQKSSPTTHFKRMMILDSNAEIKRPIRHINANALNRILDDSGSA